MESTDHRVASVAPCHQERNGSSLLRRWSRESSPAARRPPMGARATCSLRGLVKQRRPPYAHGRLGGGSASVPPGGGGAVCRGNAVRRHPARVHGPRGPGRARRAVGRIPSHQGPLGAPRPNGSGDGDGYRQSSRRRPARARRGSAPTHIIRAGGPGGVRRRVRAPGTKDVAPFRSPRPRVKEPMMYPG